MLGSDKKKNNLQKCMGRSTGLGLVVICKTGGAFNDWSDNHLTKSHALFFSLVNEYFRRKRYLLSRNSEDNRRK